MARTKTTDKASVKNGRANRGTGEAYNANHNTLEATRINQSHIDASRMKLNAYLLFDENGKWTQERGGKGGFDAKAHELKLYQHFYGDGLEARNARCIAEGHRDRCQTMEDLYRNPKTAPLETIFQVGSNQSVIDKVTRTTALIRAWNDTRLELQKQFGENIKLADAAIHRDEAQDHIHSRMLLMARDKFGHLVPNQTAALEAMGFDRPDPSKPRSRYNNALISFTDYVRDRFYTHCQEHGVEIDRDVISSSKRQVEMLEYKCEQFRKEMEESRAQAAQAHQEAQTAQKVLDESIGNIKALNGRIGALERSQAALEAKNKHLLEENNSLKNENKTLRAENAELENQAFRMQMEIDTLKKEKAAEEAAKAKAERDKAVALDKLEKIEDHQKQLFRKYQSRQVKTFGTIPAQAEKKNWRGQVVQEALPERIIVDKADFERQEQQAQYHVLVDYNKATMAELDSKFSQDEQVQNLIKQIADQQMEINGLRQTADKQHKTIMQQQDVLQRHGLEHEVGRPIHSHEHSHFHHR